MSTLDTRPPSARRNTSLRLPSCDGVSRSTSGSSTTARPASAVRKSFGRSVIAFSGASSPTMVSPGVSSSMTGGIPGTLGGTPTTGSSTTGGIPGTLGSAPFNSGGSTTGAIGSPLTQGTSTTGSTDLLGTSVLGGSSSTSR